jgi:hypothetical protein
MSHAILSCLENKANKWNHDYEAISSVEDEKYPRSPWQHHHLVYSHKKRFFCLRPLCWVWTWLGLLAMVTVWMWRWVPLQPVDPPIAENPCEQVFPRIPYEHPQLDTPFDDLFTTRQFRLQVAQRLSQAIRIRTESFDDEQQGGPQRYDGFLQFHSFLSSSYPWM